MSEVAVQRGGTSRAALTLGLGLLAAVGFFGLGFAFQGWWFVVGLVLGAAAVATGIPARRRALSKGERRSATVGIVVGAVVVAWFCAYMAIVAIVEIV